VAGIPLGPSESRHETESKNMKNQKSRPQFQSTAPQAPQTKPTEEQIAARARAIYEARGRLPGHDLENWLQAETKLLRQGNRQLGAAPLVHA